VELLVVYDISTESAAGEKRLRQVAKICEGYGQRVQKSVFECQLDPAQLRRMTHDLREVIDVRKDRVAIYRLREPYQRYVSALGLGPDLDWRKPVIL
jgi:CRISPR-associated protein Cas2